MISVAFVLHLLCLCCGCFLFCVGPACCSICFVLTLCYFCVCVDVMLWLFSFRIVWCIDIVFVLGCLSDEFVLLL